MAQQETGGGTGESGLTEEVQAETANDAGTETPALNRAERRAQAKGKKTGSGATSGLPLSGGLRGPNPRTTGAATPVRVNRTGSRSK